MSADSPRRSNIRGVPAVVPPEEVSDRSIIDSVAGFINDVTLANQPIGDPKDTIIWARFESAADISDPRFGDDWELEGNVAPPLLLILGYGLGVQIWAIPANGEAVEVLSWRHGIVSALRILPKPVSGDVSRADEPIDLFSDRRPLMAICDGGPSSQGGSNPQFCSVNFLSLRTGTQVKTIKFKNPVLDILANRTSVVVTFHERIAIFDARTLEDRLTVTTCFPSPGINPNPVALGSRWLAYSENKLLSSKRSGGGCDGDGVASYTATVLNAAKSLGKGLREFTEQVTAGLTGTTGSGTTSKSASFDSCGGDIRQPGIVTILDIKYAIKDMSPTSGTPISVNGTDPIVAHFIAHSDAIVAMEFDNSGMMLLTADKRGHNFHVFRIQPHPVGSTLAAVHHLYVLHRGDTSAKVQNISFSLDTRWVAVSTLRGTTHVFPITPYGGPPTARTHSNLHVVNKLSSFHHSAGLTADGRSSSPISHTDTTNFSQQLMPYFNQTMPPFPRPTVVLPLAQLRQPFTLSNNAPASAAAPKTERGNRQRLSSLSDDNGKPLSVCAVFAKSRSWLLDPPNLTRDGPAHKLQRKAVDSLFVMAGHGALIQYDLDVSYVAKDKKCDDKSIDLDVEAKAQWNVGRRDPNTEIMPPLPSDNWLVKDRMSCALVDSSISDEVEDRSDCWLAQVEIITHAGPSRRLWMGPQFVFKTYNTPSGSSLSHIDSEAVEIGMTASTKTNPERSSPLNMPVTSGNRSSVPVLIESGSYSSIEQSPKLMDRFRHDYLDSDYSLAHGESRLKEDLADAMRESPSVAHKNTGLTPTLTQTTVLTTSQTSSESSQSYHQIIENVVNPLGTVTAVNLLAEAEDPLADNPYVKFSPEDYVIHENCDESLFRPVVVFCDNKKDDQNLDQNGEFTKPPALIENKLVVPVIDKSLHMVLTKKEAKRVEDKFEELSSINKMSKGSAPVQKEDEDVKIKEEVTVIKGKKNKKKVAEPVKEPTPPRDTKKKSKKDIAESEEKKIKEEDIKKFKEESKKEDIKITETEVKIVKECKATPKDEVKSLKQESAKAKEPIKTNEDLESKKSIKSKKADDERKNSLEKSSLKIEAKDVVQKTAERQNSSETTESKKSKELVQKPIESKDSSEEKLELEAKPKEAIKPIEKKVIDSEPEEVVVTIKKKGKNKKEVVSEITVKQEESDSTSSEEQSLPSVKDVVDGIKSEELTGSVVEDEISSTKISETVSKGKLQDDKNESNPPEIENKEKVSKNKKKEETSELIEAKTKDISSKNDKKLLKDESLILATEQKLEKVPDNKKKDAALVTTDKKITLSDQPEKLKSNADKKETTPVREIPQPKEVERKTEQSKSSAKKSKADSRSSSPAKEVKDDEKNLETPSPIKIDPVIKTDETTTATKKKSKSKKPSRESSPDVEEVQPSPLKIEEPVNQEPVIEIKEKPNEAIFEVPEKEPVQPTITTKKKKKTKKASRESSPEIPSRKNSLKDVKPADISVFDDNLSKQTEKATVEVAVEQTVTIKKKNKAKKASRESSPEIQTEVVDDNPLKTKSNVQEKEYKVTVKEISPKEDISTKEVSSLKDDPSVRKINSIKEDTSNKEEPSLKKVSTPKEDSSLKKVSPSKEDSSLKKVSTTKEDSSPKKASPPKEEPKITDFLKFVDHFNKPDDYIYKVTVKDISPPETDNDFPSLSFSSKKSKKNKKPTPEMVLPIEKEPVPIVETISPFQPLDKITISEEGATLINFESPEQPPKINLLDFEHPKGFPEDIIFAICGNLSDQDEIIESEKEFLTSSSTASASEETTDENTTENTTSPEKKKKTKKLVSPCNLNVNDDEELRPLISTTADTLEATPTPEVLYPCKYSEKDAKSSDSSSDTGGGGTYAIPDDTAVVPTQPEQQPTNQQPPQHQNSKKKIKRRKR